MSGLLQRGDDRQPGAGAAATVSTAAPATPPAGATARAEALQPLLDHPALWRGRSAAPIRSQPTGHPGLDALLPGGGWPCGALSEVLAPGPGHGELQLVLPWLARLTRAGGRAALVCPPLLPYAPALEAAGVVLSRLLVIRPTEPGENDGLWAMEQMLQSGGFSAVLGWPQRLGVREGKRLQLAAEAGGGCGLLHRDLRALETPSTAALRLRLHGTVERLEVEVLKCRGGRPGQRWRRAA